MSFMPERNNHLLSLTKEVDRAFQIWRHHPDDDVCQKRYEMAKTQLDKKIKEYKNNLDLKYHH